MPQLEIKKLRVAIGENEIIRDLSLSVGLGEMHAVMGPNGSGKSTLAKVIAGYPDYKVTSGEVLMDDENLLDLEPDERARRGLFMAFQYPSEVPGVVAVNGAKTEVRQKPVVGRGYGFLRRRHCAGLLGSHRGNRGGYRGRHLRAYRFRLQRKSPEFRAW